MKEEENAEQFVPIWQKFTLSISEASDYFGIGEKKLRWITEEYRDSGFILQNGVKVLIKRQKFEDFLNSCSSI